MLHVHKIWRFGPLLELGAYSFSSTVASWHGMILLVLKYFSKISYSF